MPKKIYFICAPVFMYWPVAISKQLNELVQYDVVFGGFIGGPKKYHRILKEELAPFNSNVTYTHDLEQKWLSSPFDPKRLQHYIEMFGHQKLNELIISDRQVGYGYLSGGDVAKAEILEKIRSDKQAHLNYLVGLLDYVDEFFKNEKPDLIYSYAVAGAFTLAFAMFAEKLGTVFTKLSHSRISDRVIIDTCAKDSMEVVKERYFNDAVTFSSESKRFAVDYLKKLRSNPIQPDYQLLQNHIYKTKTKLKYTFRLYAKWIKGQFYTGNDFFHGSYIGNVNYDFKVMRGIKKFWREKPFYSHEALGNNPYFFYTLHVDPEASTMVISPYSTNQLALIEDIAKAKPIDHILVVKEHLTMIGRRPPNFYNKINSLPGVYMVNPLESSFNFIKNSNGVVTITGTSGFEAMMLRKPVIFVGKFIYDWIKEGFISLDNSFYLHNAFNQLDKFQPISETNLLKLLMSIHETSFSFDSGLIWSGVSKEKVIKNPNVVNSFAVSLAKHMK